MIEAGGRRARRWDLGGPDTIMSQPAMSFEEALDVLQGMFSEWSRPALSQMLQANQLNMELTIESILSIGAPPPGFGTSSGATGSTPSPMPAQGRGPASDFSRAGPGADDSGRRGARVTLPEDFLRVPGSKGLSSSQQMLLDEQLALMLQDELFLKELRRMPEFDPYTRRRAHTPQSSGSHGGPSPSSGRSRAGSGDDGLATLKKNIGDMGDTMKRRLNDMYSRFVKSREGAKDQSHVPLMDNGDDESEVVLFSNSSDTARRRGGSSGGSSRAAAQEFELTATRTANRPAPPEYHDEEEILIHTGGTRSSSDNKKLL